MKKIRIVLLSAMLVGLFVGCNENQTNVDNPPEFVEMYLNEPSVLQATDFRSNSTEGILLIDEDLTDDVIYDGVLMSESDFEVVVVTNGINYDLLFSVEVTDSALGICVYTDQSVLYVASATVTVETDGTYTTTIALTIPASTGLTTFLSERTISLTKILFTRDTANGTFPADIPENSTTSLLFEVHATEYFDETIGLPLKVNDDGLVDIILTPDSEYYAQAQTLALSEVIIPEVVNGYDIGSVILMDLNWIINLTVTGANQDVFIMGDFAALTSLTFDKMNNESITVLKYLTINGIFPVLTEMTVSDVTGYSIYISYNGVTENTTYTDYTDNAGVTLYDFPALSTLTFSEIRLDQLRIGNDNYNVSFPNLTTVTINGFSIDSFEFGNENNYFPKLDAININDCHVTVSEISGSKPVDEPAATINFDNQLASWTFFYIEGSVFSTIAFTDSNVSSIEIDGGTVLPSRFTGISFTNCVFPTSGGVFSIIGSHPNLLSLSLSNVSLGQIKIGDIGSEFEALAQISLSNVEANSIMIGERDAEFTVLEHLSITSTDVTNNLYIGGENALYPELLDISISDSSANNLTIGYFGGSFNSLVLITLESLDITSSLTVGGGSFSSIDIISMKNVTCGAASFYPIGAEYEMYIDNCLFTSALSIQASMSSLCQKVFLTEQDVTLWEYYDEVFAMGISMETGTYMPA